MTDAVQKLIEVVIMVADKLEARSSGYDQRAYRYAPELRELGEPLRKAVQEVIDEPQNLQTVILTPILADKLAGLMAMLQQHNPSDLDKLGRLAQALSNELVLLENWIRWRIPISKAAHELQQRLRELRGTEGVCYLCDPPKKLKVEEFATHDVQVHGARS